MGYGGAEATPSITRLRLETRPSLAPSTAARSIAAGCTAEALELGQAGAGKTRPGAGGGDQGGRGGALGRPAGRRPPRRAGCRRAPTSQPRRAASRQHESRAEAPGQLMTRLAPGSSALPGDGRLPPGSGKQNWRGRSDRRQLAIDRGQTRIGSPPRQGPERGPVHPAPEVGARKRSASVVCPAMRPSPSPSPSPIPIPIPIRSRRSLHSWSLVTNNHIRPRREGDGRLLRKCLLLRHGW